MKEVKLKFKTYAGSMAVVDDGNMRSKALRAILWSFAFLSLFYVLILGNTVWNIVERRALEKEARTLATDIGELELNYLSLSGRIDSELGYSLGFVESKQQYFATRKSLGSLSFLGNEL